MSQQNQAFEPPVVDASKNWMAITSLVLGVINFISCCIPCCGIPLAGVGLGLGIAGLKSQQKTLAIIGIVLNSLTLLLSLINAAYGAYLGATGQATSWQQILEQIQQQQQNPNSSNP